MMSGRSRIPSHGNMRIHGSFAYRAFTALICSKKRLRSWAEGFDA